MKKEKLVVKTKPVVTVLSLKRQITKLDDIIETMSQANLKNLRLTEKAETDLVQERGEKDELKRVLLALKTVIQFRLETAFPNPSNNYDNYGNPISQAEREPDEDEAVLRKLLEMTDDVNFKRNYNL